MDEHGVRLFPVNATQVVAIPDGIWTLSDSRGPQQLEPCDASQDSKAHLLHTSPPELGRWKAWVSRLSAVMYIMDVWSPEVFRTLLTVSDLPIDRGLALFSRYGSDVRVCLDFLRQENTYIHQLQLAASRFACNASYSMQHIVSFDFSSNDAWSKIFKLRPESLNSRGISALGFSTPFLLKTFALALARDVMDQQHVLFTILNSQPAFRGPAGWMFAHMAHVVIADPGRSPLEIFIGSKKKSSIPAPKRMISGNEAIRHVQPPFDLYWRMCQESDFKGVHAVIRKGNNVWALQYVTVATSRASAAAVAEGLTEDLEITNWKEGVNWHLVMVGSTAERAREAQAAQELVGNTGLGLCCGICWGLSR